MLKFSAANAQSVHIVTCAICGRELTFVMVKSVVLPLPGGAVKSTSNTGRSSVAAGARPMSHESSLSARAYGAHSRRRVSRAIERERDISLIYGCRVGGVHKFIPTDGRNELTAMIALHVELPMGRAGRGAAAA